MPTPETRRQLLTAVAACDDKKGEDTHILELDPADSGLADFFIITSASNDRQVVAIADEIEFRLKKEFGLYATSVEGRRQGEWILLDYVDIVIHVFLAEKRAFYDIERLRKSARHLTGPDIEAELKAGLAQKTIAVRKAAPTRTAGRSSSSSKKQPTIPTPASSRKSPAPVTPTKPSKGDSSVSPAKKAAKKAPAKAAKKAAKAPLKTAAKKAPAKAPAKAAPAPTKKAAAKTTAKKAPLKTAAKKAAPKKSAPLKTAAKKSAGKKTSAPTSTPPTAVGVTAPVEGVTSPSPDIIHQGAKPPIIK